MGDEHICHCTCPMQGRDNRCDGCGKLIITGTPCCTYCEETPGRYNEWYASHQPTEQLSHVPSQAREAFPLHDPLKIIRLHYLCEQCNQANKDLMEL